MSDDDRDIDVESDDGDESDSRQSVGRGSSSGNFVSYSQAEKRAHHNALERKRRDHIKDSFSNLRDSVPALSSEKVASRAQILKKAADYIILMKKKNQNTQGDIEELRRQNIQLEIQVKKLEKARAKLYSNATVEVKNELVKYEGESDNSDGIEITHHHLHMPPQQQQRRMAGSAGGAAAKKIKPNNYH